MQDPFGITYAGAKEGTGAFGEALNTIAKQVAENEAQKRAFQQKAGLAEVEAKVKQLYPDPITAILMKSMGITIPGKTVETNNQTNGTNVIEFPATNEATARKKAEEMGYQEGEYQVKETKGIKGMPQYSVAPTPEGMKRLRVQKIVDMMPQPKDPKNPTPDEQEAMVKYLETKDAALGGVVRQMGNYDIGTEDIGGSMGGGKQPAIAAAGKIYGFDETEYRARRGYKQNLFSGDLAKNVRSANVLVGHLDEANKSIEDFQAQNLPAKEWALETARKITGDPTITDLKYSIDVIDNETERFLTGVGVTQEGLAARRQTRDAFLGNPGYKQLKQHVRTYANIMKVRTDELEDEYKQRLKKDPGNNILLGDKKDTLNRLSTMDVTQRGSGLKEKLGVSNIPIGTTGTYEGKPVAWNGSKWEYKK